MERIWVKKEDVLHLFPEDPKEKKHSNIMLKARTECIDPDAIDPPIDKIEECEWVDCEIDMAIEKEEKNSSYIVCVHCGNRTNVRRYVQSDNLERIIDSHMFCYECDKRADLDEEIDE